MYSMTRISVESDVSMMQIPSHPVQQWNSVFVQADVRARSLLCLWDLPANLSFKGLYV